MKDIESNITEWANERGIFESATPKDQFTKLVEEVGEVAECISKSRPVDEFELELGDLYVTMVLLAHMKGTTVESAANSAYAKIMNRSGKMVDGIFIKDGD